MTKSKTTPPPYAGELFGLPPDPAHQPLQTPKSVVAVHQCSARLLSSLAPALKNKKQPPLLQWLGFLWSAAPLAGKTSSRLLAQSLSLALTVQRWTLFIRASNHPTKKSSLYVSSFVRRPLQATRKGRKVPNIPHVGKRSNFDAFSAGFQSCPQVGGASRSHVANQVDVVVQVAHKIVGDVVRRPAGVADELPLGHLVFDVRTAEVDWQQDEAVAQHVHGIWRGNNTDVTESVCLWISIASMGWQGGKTNKEGYNKILYCNILWQFKDKLHNKNSLRWCLRS